MKKNIFKFLSDIQKKSCGAPSLSALLFIFISLNACNESKEAGPNTTGYEFYPINVGEYRIYDVEEIYYLVSGFDTSYYQLKETIFDSLISSDRIVYLLRRDIRENETEEWESDSIWTVSRTTNYLSITENNISFIKLTFPVTAGRTWDGNSLNSKNELTYYYQDVGESLIDSLTTDDHIRVILEDNEEDVIGVDLRSEVYARGVGLVEKDYFTQTRCTESACGADLGEVKSGRLLKQILIEIGNEE